MSLSTGQWIRGATDVQRDLLAGEGGYGAVLADPPWRYATYSRKGRGRSPDGADYMAPAPLLDDAGGYDEDVNHYPTMTLDEICALEVAPLAHRDSVLYLWAVFNMLPEAIRVGEAWGFKANTARVWVKTRKHGFDPSLTLDQNFPMGTGYIARGNPEPLLIMTRGEPQFLGTAPRALIISPRREHSRKPDIVRRDIERQVSGPWLELFGRTPRAGWDVWGSEPDKFEEEHAAA